MEVCSGEGQLSRSLWASGLRGKAFDVSWYITGAEVLPTLVQRNDLEPAHFTPKNMINSINSLLDLSVSLYITVLFFVWHLFLQVTYSKNHNILRTVGFFAILAAVSWLDGMESYWLKILRWQPSWWRTRSITCFLTLKVRNCKKGGLLFFAPPCSTWVFLTLSGNYGTSPNKNTKQFTTKEFTIYGSNISPSLWCTYTMCAVGKCLMHAHAVFAPWFFRLVVFDFFQQFP